MSTIEITVDGLDYGCAFPFDFMSQYLPRKGDSFLFLSVDAEQIIERFMRCNPDANKDVVYGVLSEYELIVNSVCFLSNGNVCVGLQPGETGLKMLEKLFIE